MQRVLKVDEPALILSCILSFALFQLFLFCSLLSPLILPFLCCFCPPEGWSDIVFARVGGVAVHIIWFLLLLHSHQFFELLSNLLIDVLLQSVLLCLLLFDDLFLELSLPLLLNLTFEYLLSACLSTIYRFTLEGIGDWRAAPRLFHHDYLLIFVQHLYFLCEILGRCIFQLRED